MNPDDIVKARLREQKKASEAQRRATEDDHARLDDEIRRLAPQALAALERRGWTDPEPTAVRITTQGILKRKSVERAGSFLGTYTYVVRAEDTTRGVFLLSTGSFASAYLSGGRWEHRDSVAGEPLAMTDFRHVKGTAQAALAGLRRLAT